ncbi:ATP-binding protein [Thioclava sp. GXIMD4215]|uniref:ATP-binding protein n=1 Tax=Thioclava sp. GXIMD4215 TaxID=3131928 RepID=UPI00324E2B3D
MTTLYRDRIAKVRLKRQDQLKKIGVERRLPRSYVTQTEACRKAKSLFASSQNRVNASLDLQGGHYKFPRAATLRNSFDDCLHDYFVKASIGGHFEVRGLLVTGESRVGKTSETVRLVEEFNASKTPMPNGKPGRIVYCKLDGSISWKDLGHKTLEAMGYSANPRRTQGELWKMVHEQSRELGVIGLYYDECQHAFTSGPKSNEKLLDRFKALMKEPEWQLMLILSGVPVLASHVNAEEQIAHLLSHIHFDKIILGRFADPTRDPDMIELNKLVYTYADRADIDVDDLVDFDFLQRLDFACASRWGLVIELLIRAFGLCRLQGQKTATVEMFSEAYAQNSRLPQGLCPFTAPDYQNMIDGGKLMEMVLDE